MCGTTCLAIRNGPRTFTAITLSQSATSMLVNSCSSSVRVERGVVDQDVDLAEALDGLGHQRLDLLSSLTSQTMLVVALRPCLPASSSASAPPSAMSAIITSAPSAASACE